MIEQSEEQRFSRRPRLGDSRNQTLPQKVERRAVEQVVGTGEVVLQCRQQSLAATPLESIQQSLHAAARHLHTEVSGRDILEMVRLVKDESLVRRQDRGLFPVVRCLPHRQVGREQVMIDDDDIGLRRTPTGLEHEAAIEVRATEAGAEVGLRGDFVPHLARRLDGQVGERAVARMRRPRGDVQQLLELLPFQERVLVGGRRVEPQAAEIIPPSLQQRERRFVLGVGERASQQREVLPHQLFLQVDRIGRHHGALTVGAGPGQRWHQVGERLAHAGAGLQQQYAAIVVAIHEMGRQVALALAVLVTAEFARDRSVLAEKCDDVERIEARHRLRLGHLDHDEQAFAVVVHNAEADAIIVGARGDRQVRHRWFEAASRVVVQQHLAALCHAGQGEHAVDCAAGDRTRCSKHAGGVNGGHEGDFGATGRADFATNQFADGESEAVCQVFSSFFFAAGKRTLFRINRYPGEWGCSDRSVGALPMAC